MNAKLNRRNKFLLPIAVLLILVGILFIFNFSWAQDAFGVDDASDTGLGRAGLIDVINNIVQIVLGFLGFLAVLVIMYGGFMWLTSGGNPVRVEKARKTLTAAIIGLIIILSAFTIASFVIRTINDAIDDGGSGSWSPPLNTPGSANKYSYISGFRDESINWSSSVSWLFNGVFRIPGSVNLEVRGWAKNQGSTIEGMELFVSPEDGEYSSQGEFTDVPEDQELVTDVYAPWNAGDYSTDSVFLAKILVLAPGVGSFESKELKTKIAPLHCFNNIQDEDLGERGIDCGGECGACPGDPCDSDLNNSVCDPDDEVCRFGICDPDGCICPLNPEIDYISPATDVNGNTDFDDRFHNVEGTMVDTWADDIPDGAPGNYISIWGIGFGSERGEVMFDDVPANLDLYESCGDTWTDNQIIVEVPEISQGEHDVFVSAANGLTSRGKVFVVNDIERPGICAVDPSFGAYPATTTIFGSGFPVSSPHSVIWNFTPPLISNFDQNWTENSVVDTVPDNRSGQTSIKIYNGQEYSNYIKFLASAGREGDPCGLPQDQNTGICSAKDVCQSGLFCDYGQDCTCQKVEGFCDNDGELDFGEDCDGIIFKDDKNQCSDYGFGAGELTCKNCRIDSSACSGGPMMKGSATQSVYAWLFSTTKTVTGATDFCGNNKLDPEEACDFVDGIYNFARANGSECSAYGMGDGTVSCGSSCQLVFDCSGEFVAGAATQSLYYWSFNFLGSPLYGEPYVIEDCSRSKYCENEDYFPSPTPWFEGVGASEGWSTYLNPKLHILDEKACINSWVLARFSQSMDPASINPNNVIVLRCDNRTGGNCQPVGGDIEVNDGGNGLDHPDNYLIFKPNEDLSPETWYKVVLRRGIRSSRLINLRDDVSAGGRADDRYCNINGIDDAAYCWNFKTRDIDDENLLCPVGCITCAPDRSYTRWFLASKNYVDIPDSEDNVCLVLNAESYTWRWREKECLTGDCNTYSQWQVPAHNPLENIFAKSWLSDPLAEYSSYPADIYAVGGYRATTTAFKETFVRNSDYVDFKDVEHVRIEGMEEDSGHFGYCRTHNDFTNPIVIEDVSCRNGTTQSPSPWINSENACLNALVSARFSHAMVDNTLDRDNILIQECASREDAESMLETADCGGNLIVDNDQVQVFDYSHTIDYGFLLEENLENLFSPLPEGFVVYRESNFNPNTWYRVIIFGGIDGVRGSKLTTDANGDVIETDDPEGVLITPSIVPGRDYNNDGEDDYIWTFKTSDEICEVETVEVAPADKFMRSVNQTQRYVAFAQAANCNILNPCLLDWSWQSLRAVDVNGNGDDASSIADVSDYKTQAGICVGEKGIFGADFTDPVQTVTSYFEGDVDIKAEEPGSAWDYGNLQIGYGNLRVIDYFPNGKTECLNEPIKILFNIDIDTDSVDLNENIKLYQCDDGIVYYPLNNSVDDFSGALNHGEAVGSVSFANGKVNEAVSFSGESGNYIEVGNGSLPNDLYLYDNITVSAWVRPYSAPDGVGRIVASTYAYNGGGPAQRGWTFGNHFGGDDVFYFRLYNSQGNYIEARVADFFSKNSGSWVYVTGVYSRSGGFVRLYVNGQLKDSASIAGQSIAYDSTTPLRFGHRADNNDQGMWEGSIDEIKIYDRSLSEQEINALYRNNNSKCSLVKYPPVNSAGSDIYLTDDYNSLGSSYANRLILSPSINFDSYARYRVVVKGGNEDAGGVVAWTGKELGSLNYNEVGGSGEECEPNIYPWDTQAGICDSSCLLSGNICNTRFSECENKRLAAYYRFDSDFSDAQGNSQAEAHGAILDQSTVLGDNYQFAGRTYRSCYFDGQDDYVHILDDDLINLASQTAKRTISFWFRANQTKSRQVLYEEGGYSGFNVYIHNDNIYAGFFNNNTESWLDKGFSDTQSWHHLAFIFDGSTSEQKLYLDGRLVGIGEEAGFVGYHNYDIGVGSMLEFTRFQDIGTIENSGTNYHFNGWIDELMIFNNILSADEISDIYDSFSVQYYCDDYCHNLGNENISSCGNGLVESTEECDDGNALMGDGCSFNCLLEGSSHTSALCGNARIEFGESCDDGNITDGDGCSANCLIEHNSDNPRKSGSWPNVPVCGNGEIERGEDCDDANRESGDGCSSRCLFEGSNAGAACGNNLVESSKLDSYSWFFSVDSRAKVCNLDVDIQLNPCPNGIWRFIINSETVNAVRIKIQRGYSEEQTGMDCEAAESNLSFWRKAINRVVRVVKGLFSFGVTAADYWCTITESDYNINDLKNLHPDNYVQDGQGFEVIGYSEEDNNYVVNYLKDVNWLANNSYRAVVEYVGFGGQQEKQQESINILGSSCSVDDIDVSIWPVGEIKSYDAFFCDDDDCGHDLTDAYLKDQDYGFEGNQHIYRAWCINNSVYEGKRFIIKPDGYLDWDLMALGGIMMSHREISESSYSGDRWIDLRRTDPEILGYGGDAVMLIEDSGSQEQEEIDITILLCSNPWPSPQYFPFIDENNNCSTLTGNCFNTNFKTYYCRDRGDDSLSDDLPQLRNNVVISGSSATSSSILKEFLFPREDDSSDAVGIRVSENKNHYSPLAWYRLKFPVYGGTTKSLTVDDYDAIEEGRTTYVGGADLNESGEIFSDIYLMSYNEGAEQDTVAIYEQMRNYLHLNAGSDVDGGLYSFGSWGVCENKLSCEDDSTCIGLNLGSCDNGFCSEDFNCIADANCALFDLGYCDSQKAKLTRDNIRLGDLQDINFLVADYLDVYRCSNDHGVSCFDNSQCYGGGICGKYYPTLRSGTYISGKSFSVWPSWQATLGNLVGSALPLDPINRFVGCSDPYNEATCWDEVTKSFDCPDEDLSKVYVYYSYSDAGDYYGNVYAGGEFNVSGSNWRPAWTEVDMIEDYYQPNVFEGFRWALSSLCPASSPTSCGKDIDNDGNWCDVGENCHTCWADCSCSTGQVCRESVSGTGDWSCRQVEITSPDWDGDGVINSEDACPWDASKWENAGYCGCGALETDDDRDGMPNCVDTCPADANKTEPGICGCGVADTDDDGDGTPNCTDGCPGDAQKTAPGICGCGESDFDLDNDGVICDDQCPYDANKTEPGICGCGHLDEDHDADGLLDCFDNCPDVYNPDQRDSDNDCPDPANRANCGGGDLCDSCYDFEGRCVQLTISQGSWSRVFYPYVSSQTPSDFYCYNGTCSACTDSDPNTFCSEEENSGNIVEYNIVKARRSNIFAYIDLNTQMMSLGFIHDAPGSQAGVIGRARFNIYGDGWQRGSIVVRDGESHDNVMPYLEFDKSGTVSHAGDGWYEGDWYWGDCCTDGGMIEIGDLDTYWSVVVEPNFFNEYNNTNWIDEWVAKGPGALEESKIDIPYFDRPVVISYGPARCGNGIIEGGEECDCGEEEFDSYSPTETTGVCFVENNLVRNVGDTLPAVINDAYSSSVYDMISFCNTSCERDFVSAPHYCGDGYLDADEEECDSNDSGCVSCQFTCPDVDGGFESDLFGPFNFSKTGYNPTAPSSISFTIPDCRLVDSLTADLEISGSLGSIAVVFASDRSGSMNESALKSSLNSAIDKLFQEFPMAQVGLISFNENATMDTSACTNFVCGIDQVSQLHSIVNNYTVGGVTEIDDALQMAYEQIFNVNDFDNEVMILMSDGSPNAQDAQVITKTNNWANQNKSIGVQLYSAGFTDNVSLLAALNYWSSNDGAGNQPDVAPTADRDCSGIAVFDACAFGSWDYFLKESYTSDGCYQNYCFGSTNLSSLYSDIINSIRSGLSSGVSVTIDGLTTTFNDVVPGPNGEAVTYSKSLNIPSGFCQSTDSVHSMSAEILGGGQMTNASLSIKRVELSYCPWVDVGLLAVNDKNDQEAFNGQVAGDFESVTEKSNNVRSLMDKIISFIKKLFL